MTDIDVNAEPTSADRFMDSLRVSVNLLGNCVATLVVARREGQLDSDRMGKALAGEPVPPSKTLLSDRGNTRYRDGMTRSVLAWLLVAWCLLCIAPGVLTVVALGVHDVEQASDGRVLAVWIGGYLVSVAVWFMIARKAKGDHMVGWPIASLVPWAACWYVPQSLWWALPFLAIVGGYALWFYRTRAQSDVLQANGIPATGTVLEVVKPVMNVVVNNAYIKRTLRLRIQRDDATPPYEAKYRGTCMLGDIPSPGDSFRLRSIPPIRTTSKPMTVWAAPTWRLAQASARGRARRSLNNSNGSPNSIAVAS